MVAKSGYWWLENWFVGRVQRLQNGWWAVCGRQKRLGRKKMSPPPVFNDSNIRVSKLGSGMVQAW